MARNLTAVTPAMALMIQDSARNIQRLKREEDDIRKMLEELTKNSPAVQTLKEKRGIGTVTAATMIAEIIDIRRFAREDNLAGYSGTGHAGVFHGRHRPHGRPRSCSTTG